MSVLLTCISKNSECGARICVFYKKFLYFQPLKRIGHFYFDKLVIEKAITIFSGYTRTL